MKNPRSKPRRRLKFLAAVFVLLICLIAYFQYVHRSKRVESNIFKQKTVLTGHNSEIWTTAFSPDGRVLASGGVDSSIKICDPASGTIIKTLKQPAGVTYLAWSPDGNFIATGAYDGKIRLWKFPEGSLVREFSVNAKTNWALDFSPDGKLLACAGEDAAIKIWDIESSKLVRTITGHKLNIWDINFSPDGSEIASGSFDATVKIWDAASGKLLHNLTEHTEAIVSLAFSPDGNMLATTSDDKTIKLWDANSWKLTRTLNTPEHTQASAFSPDSKMLLTGGRDKPAAGEFLQNFFGDAGYNKGVSMRLWDAGTGKLLQTFSAHANDVNDVSWSRDGKWIASGSSDKTVQLWELAAK